MPLLNMERNIESNKISARMMVAAVSATQENNTNDDSDSDSSNHSIVHERPLLYPYSVITGVRCSRTKKDCFGWKVGDWCWEENYEDAVDTKTSTRIQVDEDDIPAHTEHDQMTEPIRGLFPPVNHGLTRASWYWQTNDGNGNDTKKDGNRNSMETNSHITRSTTKSRRSRVLSECAICCLTKPREEFSRCPGGMCSTNVCAVCQLRYIRSQLPSGCGDYGENEHGSTSTKDPDFSSIGELRSKWLCCQTDLDVREFAKIYFPRDGQKLLTPGVFDSPILIRLLKQLKGVRKASEDARAAGFYNEAGLDSYVARRLATFEGSGTSLSDMDASRDGDREKPPPSGPRSGRVEQRKPPPKYSNTLQSNNLPVNATIGIADGDLSDFDLGLDLDLDSASYKADAEDGDDSDQNDDHIHYHSNCDKEDAEHNASHDSCGSDTANGSQPPKQKTGHATNFVNQKRPAITDSIRRTRKRSRVLGNTGDDDVHNKRNRKTRNEGSRDLQSNQKEWAKMFSKLVLYKNMHNTTMIPRHSTGDPALSAWVSRQRKCHRDNSMPSYRRDMLNSIGFVWDAQEHNRTKWMAMFSKLVAYKHKYNTTAVPLHNDEFPGLRQWITTQRGIYREKKMIPYRKDLLNSIGFVWRVYKTGRNWMSMFEKLVAYKRKHNTTVVTQSCGNGSLRRWIAMQRHMVKTGELPDDRRTLLDSIGFEWDEDEDHILRFAEMFQLLVEYKKLYRHTQVPHRWEENPKLGNWVTTQREKYTNGTLSKEHFDLLEALKFVWDPILENSIDLS